MIHKNREISLSEPLREFMDQQHLRIAFLDKKKLSVKPVRLLRLSPFAEIDESTLLVPNPPDIEAPPSAAAKVVLQFVNEQQQTELSDLRSR